MNTNQTFVHFSFSTSPFTTTAVGTQSYFSLWLDNIPRIGEFVTIYYGSHQRSGFVKVIQNNIRYNSETLETTQEIEIHIV